MSLLPVWVSNPSPPCTQFHHSALFLGAAAPFLLFLPPYIPIIVLRQAEEAETAATTTTAAVVAVVGLEKMGFGGTEGILETPRRGSSQGHKKHNYIKLFTGQPTMNLWSVTSHADVTTVLARGPSQSAAVTIRQPMSIAVTIDRIQPRPPGAGVVVATATDDFASSETQLFTYHPES